MRMGLEVDSEEHTVRNDLVTNLGFKLTNT